MRSAIATLALVIFSCDPCLAAFTDFSDYTQNTRFAVGEEFQSNGLEFKAIDFVTTLTETLIHVSSHSGAAVLAVANGVEFLLPDDTQEVSFFYINGGGWLISINGVEPTLPRLPGRVDPEPSNLDGMSVAGVAVSVDSTIFPSYLCSECGLFTLRGPITSFAIAGVEMSIDDVSVIVPEPSIAALLLTASISLLATRQRHVWRNKGVRDRFGCLGNDVLKTVPDTLVP